MAELGIEKILTMATFITALLVAVIFMIVTVILDYHWKKYIVDAGKIKSIRAFYFGISLVLVILMALTLFAIVL